MTLFQAWVDSVSLLKPKNLKLFVLVTLKSIGDAYKVLFRDLWLLYVIICGCYLFAGTLIPYEYADLFSRWTYQVLLFAALLSTRPSLMPKNNEYFKSYILYFPVVIPLILFFPEAFWPTALSPIYLFIMLFYMDSSKNSVQEIIGSFVNGIKMIIYNYPLLFIVGLVFYIPLYCVYQYVYFSPLLHNLLAALLMPIGVCTYTNIYIKKLHDQFDLYFKQPK